MATSISKTWKDAGYRPGQYQKLTITFNKRDGDKVSVKWKLKVKSNGVDNYDYHTRHNKAIIYQPKKVARSSKTYQAKGTRAKRTVSGKFTIDGVADNTTSLDFYYKNKRVWVKHTDANEPRSTGVVKKTKVGSLKIPANGLFTISFNEVINDNITTYECYNKKSFTIPDLKPTSHYYEFQGWTKKDYAGLTPSDEESEDDSEDDVEITPQLIDSINADFFAGNSISSVTEDINFYGVWRCRTCTYRFYNYDGKSIVHTEIHKYGTSTVLPNLDIIKNGEYKVPGYTFKGWKLSSNKEYLLGSDPFSACDEWPDENSASVVINFFPLNTPDLNTVKFYYSNKNNDIKEYSYYTDSLFDLSLPLKDKGYTPITVNPGYKLVGWSTIPMKDRLALPGQSLEIDKRYRTSAGASSTYKIYPISGTEKFDYGDFKKGVLQLYAYYEYYTTSYIYVNGEWKLAMPYVYKDNKWNMALSYVYTNNGWKL